MFDLAQLLAPAATVAPQAQNAPVSQAPTPENQQAGLKEQWDSYLKAPAVQAGLLSFGLSALGGGYGSPSQNLAYAAGQGFEAAGNVSAQQQAEAEKASDKAYKRGRDEKEDALKMAELKNRTENTKIAASSRENIATLRRAGGPQNLVEYKMWNAARAKALTILTSNPLNISKDPMELDDAASQMADEQLAQGRARFPNLAGGNPQATLGDSVGAGEIPGDSTQPNVAAPVSDPLEGRTATGADGKKIVRKNGQWVPM